ncbi:MAG: selenium-dependent xanthine dehydrogenase, partial [Oscillospiraceae bacterium]|nr:selenium-dependent xanthine dehydrogenase [Oscillospiraceae bacterium]
PGIADVREAIKGNVCRCTGYKKIEKAILLAAEFFREGKPVPVQEDSAGINRIFHRIDAGEKVLGLGKYANDIHLPGMLHLRALRPPCARARLVSLDLEKAKKHPDCAGIITAEDVPNNKSGHIVQDWDTLIGVGQISRYVGDAVALVASEKKESLEEIISLIDAKWEELEPVKSPFDALREGAPRIHEDGNVLSMERLKRGDASEAIRTSAFKVTKKYKLPFGEHAFLEPECAVAVPEGDGVRVYTGGQSVYDEQREISHILGLEPEKVRCTSMLVGGAFGGKEDMSVQHHAALAAWILKRPVKMKLSRQESIERHPKRHAMEMEFTTACDENGYLTGMKASIISDTGAYASLGGPVLQRACTHAAGPYNYHNIDITGMAVYTNNVPAGAFRGFGVTQSSYAAENNLNVLAEMAGISPWEIRYRNAIRPGQVMPNGQIADESTALVQCLEAVKEDFEKEKCAGIACAFKNSGVGVGIPDTGRCIMSVEDGAVHIRSSAACVGQGAATVWLQMLCETSGLNPSQIVVEKPDTLRTPDSGTSTASRQTAITGEAVRRAAEKLMAALQTCGALEELE